MITKNQIWFAIIILALVILGVTFYLGYVTGQYKLSQTIREDPFSFWRNSQGIDINLSGVVNSIPPQQLYKPMLT